MKRFTNFPFSIRDLFDDYVIQFLGVNSTLPLMDEFFHSHYPLLERPKYPKTNYFIEKDGTSIFQFAFTGIDRKNLSIMVENNILNIEATPDEEEKKQECYYVFRDLAGRASRISIRLSDQMDTEKISSTYFEGLLTVRIPIKEEMKPTVKNIQIS